MKKILAITLSLAGMVAMSGCTDVFEPAVENNLGIDHMYVNSTYAENVLGNAYIAIPGYSFEEVGTDDAVSNDAGNSFRIIAGGRWTSANNPISRWENSRMAIQYCNIFLQRADKVNWAEDPEAAQHFHDRFVGEAHALRALHMYYLLRAHGGYDKEGNLLGVPIVTEPEDATSNFNVPRNSFKECIDALLEDCQAALDRLPTEYGPAYFDQLRQRYPGVSDGILLRVYGEIFQGRISGRMVEAIKARALLLAASPAFSNGSGYTYEDAAKAQAAVLNRIGGVDGMDPNGLNWYCDPAMKDLGAAECPAEVMWRTEKGEDNSREQDNFPPTLFGRGRINPTQNFVDAFPMANGYPIADSRSGYDKANPYAARDPRLEKFVLYDGGTAGINNAVIRTAADGTTNDALNKVSTSTRTGYYLKKMLRQDVNCDPNSSSKQFHYTARLRFTEFFLNYAEAANEAWGPTGTGGNAYSAYDVVKAIRKRAGIGTDNGDEYLESVKGDKEKMRELIRNERRIELSFEGFRFYDIRRWKAPLNEAAMGVSITEGKHNVIEVETRNYGEHMHYGPVPYSEILKYSRLQQNAGW